MAAVAVLLVVVVALVLVVSQSRRGTDDAFVGPPRLHLQKTFATGAGVTVRLGVQQLGQTGSIVSVGTARHGTVQQTGPSTLHYTPDPGYLGDDTFTYSVTTDATGETSTGTGTVSLTRVCKRSVILVPSCGVWWGAAQVPGGPDSILAFSRLVDSPVPVAHLYASNGEIFPTPQERALVAPGGVSTVLFGNLKPTNEYGQSLSWAQVAAGDADAYLQDFAAAIAQVPGQVFLTVHHEPEDEVISTPGSGWTTEDYVAMYRHVVEVIDAGVAPHQVVWVWTVSGYPRWEGLWRTLFPGSDVVDWIGYDPYLADPAGCDFSCVVNRTWPQYPTWHGFYDWALVNLPNKPMMLGEWGVEESPGQPGTAKASLFASIPEVLPQYPRLHAIVYFNDNLSPFDTLSRRVDTSQEALDAFRRVVRDPYLASAGSDVPVSPSRG